MRARVEATRGRAARRSARRGRGRSTPARGRAARRRGRTPSPFHSHSDEPAAGVQRAGGDVGGRDVDRRRVRGLEHAQRGRRVGDHRAVELDPHAALARHQRRGPRVVPDALRGYVRRTGVPLEPGAPNDREQLRRRAELDVGGKTYTYYALDALQSKYDVARLPFSLKVLLENVLRNEDGDAVRTEDVEALATWDHARRPERGDRLHARARGAAGLHRRPLRRRPRRDARRAWPTWAATPTVIEPQVPAELVIDHSVQVDSFGSRDSFAKQRRARVRAQRGALPAAQVGPAGVREVQGRPAGHGHRPPGQPRVPRARRVRQRRRPVPGHAGRDGLAHDDDQRPRRARLGRRRHRGGGGHARPADVDADPAGDRLQAQRRAARGRDRDRPRPDRHRDAARLRRRRQVRRVLRARAWPSCRSPTARRSAT